MLDSIDLTSLAALNALLQESSVSGAARRLGLSTPAVSHALARLRQRFDDPLLVRAGRAMVLTPRAEQLRPLVSDAILAAERVFADKPDFAPERMKRELRVSATDYVLRMFGTRLDAVIRARAPGLELLFLPNASNDPELLRTGETDLTIGIYGDLPPELKTRKVITDRFVCVVRRGNPLVDAPLTLEQFVALEHIQVAPRGRRGGYVDELLAKQGLRRRVTRAVPFFSAALDLVANSDRILTISERIARLSAPELDLELHEPPLPLEPFALSLVWHPRFDADPGHAWLREQFLNLDAAPHTSARRSLSKTDPTGRR